MNSIADMPPAPRHLQQPGIEQVALRFREQPDQPRQRDAQTRGRSARVGQTGIGFFDHRRRRRPEARRRAPPRPGCPGPPARRTRDGAARRRAARRRRPRCHRASPLVIRQAERIAHVVARHRGEHQRGVPHRARHRPGAGDAGERAGRPLRHAPVARLQPDQPAPRRRNADRAAGIGADMQRPEPRRRRPRRRRTTIRRCVHAGFHGLRVIPFSGQSPGDFQPNSVVVVLPSDRPRPPLSAQSPAARRRRPAPDRSVRLPRRVGKPARSTRSFTVHGTPSSSPIGRPARQRISLSPAAASACGFITAKAFSRGLSRATRSVTACSTSTGLSARRANSAKHLLGGQQGSIGAGHGLLPAALEPGQHGPRPTTEETPMSDKRAAPTRTASPGSGRKPPGAASSAVRGPGAACGRTLGPTARAARWRSRFDSDHETIPLRDADESPMRISQGQYGARSATPRIRRLLERESVPATFFYPAVSALLHPDEVRASPAKDTRSASIRGFTRRTRRCRGIRNAS